MSNREISQLLLDRRDVLASSIVERIYATQPELDEQYGSVGRDKSLQDTRYHLDYLAEAVSVASPELFVDYVAWAAPMLERRGVPPDCLRGSLEVLRDILLEELAPEIGAVLVDYFEAGFLPFRHLEVSREYVTEDVPHSDLARNYLNFVMQGERHKAVELILDAVKGGLPVRDVYLHIFRPVQYEIGRLWQMNEISVAQEHYATAVTQLAMSRLYPYIFSTERIGHELVATCVSGELHEIGARMVADFFEMAGWDTFYLGADTPVGSIVQMLVDRRIDVLAISATMTVHVRTVEQLIVAVRNSAAKSAKILVGGYPFNLVSDLWQRVGADGYAQDADSAVSLASSFLSD